MNLFVCCSVAVLDRSVALKVCRISAVWGMQTIGGEGKCRARPAAMEGGWGG